jgi:hypothetical protein
MTLVLQWFIDLDFVLYRKVLTKNVANFSVCNPLENKEINVDFLFDDCLRILQFKNYCELKLHEEKQRLDQLGNTNSSISREN